MIRKERKVKKLRYITYDNYNRMFLERDLNNNSSSYGTPDIVYPTQDKKFGLSPVPDASNYTIEYEYWKVHTDLSAHGDTPTIPDRFSPVITDGATAFAYQYRGETQQYQLNFARFEQGIKNMQSLLINKYEYVRSTVVLNPSVTSNYFTMESVR